MSNITENLFSQSISLFNNKILNEYKSIRIFDNNEITTNTIKERLVLCSMISNMSDNKEINFALDGLISNAFFTIDKYIELNVEIKGINIDFTKEEEDKNIIFANLNVFIDPINRVRVNPNPSVHGPNLCNNLCNK